VNVPFMLASMRQPIRALIVGVSVLLAAACSTSVGGTAEVRPGSPSSVSAASPTAGDSSVPLVPSRVSPTSSSAALRCGAGALSPQDGDFCYQIPAGFHDISTTARYPGTDSERTAVQPIGSGYPDVITVTSTTLGVNSDSLSDEVLRAHLEIGLQSGSAGWVSQTPLTQSTVAGGRAFGTTITFSDRVQTRSQFIYSGRLRVLASCQWLDHRDDVLNACAEVLKTLQIQHL